MYIHTFEATTYLTNEKFYDIQKELRNDKDKWKAERRGMTYFGLSDKGILIKMYQIKKPKFYTYTITYRISARRVIDNDNYVGLFNTKDYSILKDKINHILNKKCDLLPDISTCTLRRLDFCINAELDSQEQVKAYINTARRANIPAKLKRYEVYNEKAKRTKPTDDDMTVYNDGYIAISIYNKYAQMKKEKKVPYSEKDLSKAKNIVRIEIRCMEEKIQVLQKKFSVRTIDEFMVYADTIGDSLYNYYLPKMFGSGEICTLKEAVRKIEMSEFKKKNIELMKEFIEDANTLRSAFEAVKFYTEAYGKKEVKRILYLFDHIDTNYVTATNADAKLFNKSYIPTPIELYNDTV